MVSRIYDPTAPVNDYVGVSEAAVALARAECHEQDRQAVKKRLIRRLENLGYHVSLEAVAQIA